MLALSGKPVAERLSQDIIQKVDALKANNVHPTLAIVRVGDEAEQLAYERAAIKKAQSLGIGDNQIALPQNASTEEVIHCIDQLNQNPKIHGILLLQPLPAHIDNQQVKNTLSPLKDVDCCNEKTLGKFFIHYGNQSVIAPCTAESVITLLDHYKIALEGKNVVVLGRSLVIGRPVATMLTARHATVTLCHSKTQEEALINTCQQADIIVSAMGVYDRLPRKAIGEHHTLIDVGINFVAGKLKGDFNPEKFNAKAFTPVPGGIGTITSTILMKHLVNLAIQQTS